MKKWIAAVLCTVLVLLSLAGCQGAEAPYVTGDGAQNGQLVPGDTTQQNVADQTDGKENLPTEDGQQTTQSTEGQQGGQQATQPTQGQQGGQTQTEPEDYVLPKPEDCTYEEYTAMTPAQQEAFFNQFNGDFEAFFAWLNKAMAESDANSGDIVIDPDTTIDLDDIFGKDN